MKLPRSWYQQPALTLAPQFIGKYLVYHSSKGTLSGMISDVEAYPSFTDDVSHGNKRTRRTEVMYREGGYAYIYLIYGMYYQFCAVVNKKEIPEVVFIRGVIPAEGTKIMKENYGKDSKDIQCLTSSPGKLCKAFGMSNNLYGEDLTAEILYIEDRGVAVKPEAIKVSERIGISKNLVGWSSKLRFYIDKNDY